MRFLMLNWRDPRNPQAGGAERVTAAYLAGLAARGHEVFWFANRFPGAAPTERIGAIQVVRGGGVGTSILAARRWCRQQAPFDLVIDQHHGIPWFAPWWCRTRCIAYIHEVLGPIWNSFYPWPVSALGRAQERWTHGLYRKVPFWTACAATQTGLREHGARDVTLIPYGVNTRAVAALEDKPLEQPLRLIVVSRLAPNKRIDHAVRALGELLGQGTRARLTIVGAGGEESRLRQLIGELKLSAHVTLTGALSEADKDAELRRAHLLLHTSVREGWGLNVIEANALGTPAVVYPVAGLIESTLHEETGLVAAAETPAALAASLASVLERPVEYAAYRRNAWQRAKTFHWEAVLPPACEWLEKMAGRRRPN